MNSSAVVIGLALTLAAPICTLSRTATAQCRPMTGCEVAEFGAIDNAMLSFMCDNNVPGATLAVARDGVLLYQRGYGWADEALAHAMEPHTPMRLASVSKPITVAAVRQLITDGVLDLNDYVFDLGQPQGGLLSLDPFPTLGDPRLADVTVRHLIEHRGGWNRDIAGDLTYREVQIASAMGIPSPPGREQTVRYILGQPLQFTPDSGSNYSNIGCLVLGLIVEQKSGMPLDRFIQERLLTPIGVDDADHQAGRTFASDQDPREHWYHSSGTAVNVFDPAGPRVPPPYGGWDHEARIGQGGQTATAASLAKFAAHFWVNGDNIGRPKPPALRGSWRWNHTGSLTGTGTLIRQRGDGVTYAVLFNSTGRGPLIRDTLDPIFDAMTAWPTSGPQCCPTDLNADTLLNFFDLAAFLNLFQAQDPTADWNNDTLFNFFDLASYINAFNAGCP